MLESQHIISHREHKCGVGRVKRTSGGSGATGAEETRMNEAAKARRSVLYGRVYIMKFPAFVEKKVF